MTRRKGELSAAQVDREYPHQVALADPVDHAVRFERSKAIIEFCKANELTVSPRGHSFIEKERWHVVHCFAAREHAEAFKAKFGGEWFDPRERGRGSAWATRRKTP